MKRLIIIFLTTILFCSCGTNSEDKESQNFPETSPVETPEEVINDSGAIIEAENPSDYLSVTFKSDIKKFAQDVIEGSIKNSSDEKRVKNIILEIKYYNKSNKLLNSEEYTVYGIVNPNASINFKASVYAPIKTKSVKLFIKRAFIVN